MPDLAWPGNAKKPIITVKAKVIWDMWRHDVALSTKLLYVEPG